MTNSKFRPRFECLEGRDVPASLSFTLTDGEIGSGSFTTPAGVDASQAAQTFALTDLVVSVHGKTMGAADLLEDGGENEDGVATARFAYGVLVGVKAEYLVPGTANDLFSLLADQAKWMPYPYPQGASTGGVTFDGADTQATFTLPGDVTGALSYDIPWDQVDATQASQSIPLTTFNLNIAGQNFTYGSANFTTNPSALFEYGEFKGLSYVINTSATPGFAYSSVSQSGMTITAVPNVGQPVFTSMVVAQRSIVLDFTQVTTGQSYVFRIRLLKGDGTAIESSGWITVSADATRADITDAVATALSGGKFKVTVDGNKVKIVGDVDSGWSQVEFSAATTVGAMRDNTIKPPKYIITVGVTNYTFNGVEQIIRN